MFKKSTSEFNTRLWETISAIEQDSQIEIVVIMRPRAESYRDIAFMWGLLAAWLSFTYLMFAPDLFRDEVIYGAPQVAFVLGCMIGSMPVLTRLCASKRRMQKSVEIMARALFQKGGIRHTQNKTGVLVYGSWLEKTLYLVPDRGAEMTIPGEEWQALRAGMQSIFAGGDVRENLLAQLTQARQVFQRYLPALENDINELPDDLEIDL